MKKLNQTIAIVLTLSTWSCQEAFEHNAAKNSQTIISGEWTCNQVRSDSSEVELSFVFDDKFCSLMHPYNEFPEYRLIEDTLIVTGEKEKLQFLIKPLNENEIELIPYSKNEQSLLKLNTYKEQPTSLTLERIANQNNFNFDRIGFSSGPCFGECPVMYLEFDSIGNFLFCGVAAEKRGVFTGKLNRSELNAINQKANLIKLDSTDQSFGMGWMDAQYCSLYLKAGENTFRITGINARETPVEIRILFKELMGIYKKVDLKEDVELADKFYFDKLRESVKYIIEMKK